MPGRGLLTLLLLLATAAASPADPTPTLPPQPQRLATAVAPEDEIHTVHLVMSHHLDVGLDLPMKITADCVGFATKIVQRYFDIFIPRILRLAEEQAAHPEPFVYQIHSWIASLYVDCVPWRVRTDCPANPGTLRCPSPAAVARFDKAVRNGTIAYTASPFNIDAQDVGDPALFVDEVRDVAGALDARYGRAEGARVWSNVDVKGFARASIPLLRAAGVHFLSIGQNGHPSNDGGSHSRGMQPAVGGSNATMFRWRDKRSGEEVVVLYHDVSRHDIAGIWVAFFSRYQ